MELKAAEKSRSCALFSRAYIARLSRM